MLTEKNRDELSGLTSQSKDILGTDEIESGKILDFPFPICL